MSGTFYHQDEDRKILREELLTTKARDWAISFLKGRPSLNSAQLRRFYHDVKALEAQVDSKKDFKQIRPHIKMLKSKVAYACPENYDRGKKVPVEFKRFLDTCVDHIEKKEDFEAFVKVFEAVVGYFVGEGGGRR